MVYRVSNSPVHLSPEDPVLDIAECWREETRFLPEVGHCPKVVGLFLREVNSDHLWGMWAIVVNSWCPTRGMRPRKVEGWGKAIDLRGPLGWAVNFSIELEWIGESQVHWQKLKGSWQSRDEETHIKERNPCLEGGILVFVFECGSTTLVPKGSLQKTLVQILGGCFKGLHFVKPVQVRARETGNQAISLHEASDDLIRSKRIDGRCQNARPQVVKIVVDWGARLRCFYSGSHVTDAQ